MGRQIRAAAVHAAPMFMDKTATLNKVVDLIKTAKADAVELMVFPETFVPGYPVCNAIQCAMINLVSDADPGASTSSNATHHLTKCQRYQSMLRKVS